MKSKFLTIALSVLITFCVMLMIMALTLPSIMGKFNTPRKDLNQIEEQIKQMKIRDERIRCMAKTLVVAYDLDKWMAHYLSVVFNDFSEAYSIPWEIYPSIVRIESSFKPTLVSPKGAKGLMQILESTGRETASKVGINYTESLTLWNEIHNLVIGCTYLSDNIKKLGTEGGVKAYLGGPGYLKTIKSNSEHRTYISEYKSSVWVEFKKLSYIYRGVVDEVSFENKGSYDYDQIKVVPSYTVPIDMTLFTKNIEDSLVPEQISFNSGN